MAIGLVAPDDSADGAPFFACGEASADGGETGHLTRINDADQSMLLNVPGEIFESSVVHPTCVGVLREEKIRLTEVVVRLKKAKGFLEKKTLFKNCEV